MIPSRTCYFYTRISSWFTMLAFSYTETLMSRDWQPLLEDFDFLALMDADAAAKRQAAIAGACDVNCSVIRSFTVLQHYRFKLSLIVK